MNTFLNGKLHIFRDAVNYASIAQYKKLLNEGRCKGEKLTVKDFLTLSSGNDPFYADSPRGRQLGEWFADQWREHKGHEARVHVRGLHYALVGRTNSVSPVYLPNGKVYENTEKCWKVLEQAGKYARYNGFIEVEKFEDRRAQSLYERVYDEPAAAIGVDDPVLYYEIDFPDFPSLPWYTINYQNRQRYRLEVWCEKSTQETVLAPVVDRYKITMLSAQGELSISAMLKAIRRAESTPTRILYISDFDPAGRSMPVAASRKLEFLQKILGSRSDIQLYPIALTHDQCVRYQLDRTPIKESEKRRLKFEERYGSGATELDALEAKYPGELARMLEGEILAFYDNSLVTRTEESARQLRQDARTIQWEIHRAHAGEDLRQEYNQLRAEFEEWQERRWNPFVERLTGAYEGIRDEMIERMPDIDEYPLPSAKEVPTLENCLYDSSREYLEQIAAYSAFTGKFSHLITDDEDEEEA